MVEEAEVRERLAALLGDQISLDDFEDWLVSHSWNMHRDSSLKAQQLAWAIQLPLMAYSDDRLSRDQLRRELDLILNHPEAQFSIDVLAAPVRMLRPASPWVRSVDLVGLQPALPVFSARTSSSGTLVMA